MKIIKGFNSLEPTYKMFFISATISSLLTIYFLLDYVPEIIYGIVASSITLVLFGIFLAKYAAYPSSKWLKRDILLLILAFITVSHLPCHFISSSRIAYRRKMKDDLLIKIDNYLLGWLFPDGQISLQIDKNNFLGPHTTFGRFINNSLQISYFFYYLILILQCIL